MNEDQWLALAKSNQDASYKEGYNAARDEYTPVLMEHLRILADLRAGVEALRDEAGRNEHASDLANYETATFEYRAEREVLDKVLALMDRITR